jgi:two-component system, LytTR family, response regulator
MITTVLIDDEPLARALVKEYLAAFPDIQVVQECGDGFEGMKAIMQYRPQLIFLDIQMPKINGFEMLELIEEPPAVIFVTAFDEYAIKAFEMHAVDYLLKPFSRERFARAIEKIPGNNAVAHSQTQAILETAAESPAQRQRIVVKTAGRIRIIPVHELRYLEAADDYVKLITKDGSFLKNRTMAHFEKVLDASLFVRTHRSFIINIHEITRIEPYEKETHLAILKDGKQVPVSKTGYAKLKEVLGL